jgi:cell division protein FtsB
MKFKFNKKILYVIIVVAVLGFIFGSRGFRNLIGRKKEQIRLRKELKELKFENAKLRKEIYLLQNDDSYIEHLIRRDLGYLKPGEFEYRFKEE